MKEPNMPMVGNSEKDLLDEQAERIAALEAENERLQEAKRMAGLIADERSKENVALRAIVDELRTSDGIVKRDAEIERLKESNKWLFGRLRDAVNVCYGGVSHEEIDAYERIDHESNQRS